MRVRWGQCWFVRLWGTCSGILLNLDGFISVAAGSFGNGAGDL